MVNWHRFTPADFEYDSDHYGLANMSTKDKTKKKPSETEIDRMVVAQADDESAWEKPIRVRRAKPASLSIPADLAARAAFLARLHRKATVDEWLTHVIQQRVEVEEAAFAEVKRDLGVRGK